MFSTLDSTGSCLPDLLQWTLALTSAVNTHCPFHGDSLARWDLVLAAAVYLAALTKLLGLRGQHNAMLAATAIWFGFSFFPKKLVLFSQKISEQRRMNLSPNRIRTEQPLHVHAGEGKLASGGNPKAVFFIFFYVLKFIDLEFLRDIKMEFQKTWTVDSKEIQGTLKSSIKPEKFSMKMVILFDRPNSDIWLNRSVMSIFPARVKIKSSCRRCLLKGLSYVWSLSGTHNPSLGTFWLGRGKQTQETPAWSSHLLMPPGGGGDRSL